MSENIGSALWGKKEGGAARRGVAAVAVAVVALAAPALANAGSVPTPLLAEAQANPNQVFDVIIQTMGGAVNPADAAIQALTADQRSAFDTAARSAADTSRRANDLAKKAADVAAVAGQAQQRARDAAARAARTGKPADIAAAAKAQADANQTLAAAQAAQAALTGMQVSGTLGQLTLAQAQASLVMATAQAQGAMRAQYSVIPAVDGTVTGAGILHLQASGDIVAVTPDAPVSLTADSNPQAWVDAMTARPYWASWQRRVADHRTPTIAIVDSGIDGSRAQDFGGRVLGQVNLASVPPNSAGDGRGHGTMVASIAAGGYDWRTGANPDAPMISLDVINDNGEGRTSDVIAAADWILRNRNTYNIRVANFSLQGAINSSFLFDPLSKAVEQLWFNGVVVVAAAGNYASGGAQSGVLYAPASDPFVISVGAVDIGKTGPLNDDVAAPWSAWGYTNDGFAKPEISAPGRYIIGACTQTATLCKTGGQDPSLAPQGYIQLSGTSFAAPMVSGAAAAILALHPDWTPDQVKGQLMLTANALPRALPGSVGVGELDMKAATGRAKTPPNPNLALESFLVQTPTGLQFDAASWMKAAQANPLWNAASWTSASWNSASWNSASWNSASWNSASWNSASWNSASWTSATTSLALDNALLDGYGGG